MSTVQESPVTSQAARIDLAAAHRLAVLDGLAEGTWNHFSHRLRERPGHMLMTPAYFHWSRVRASDLVELDENEETARQLGPSSWAGYSIHYPLYEARPDISCALHAHPPYTTALASVVNGRLEPASQQAITLHSRIAYADEWADDENESAALRGDGLAHALGDADILILNHHGVLVVGATVGIAYTLLYQVERACRVQVLAMSTGRPLATVSERFLAPRDHGRLDKSKDDNFRGLKAMLDATRDDYAT